jgi:Ca-activated chloride channel family protein
LLILSPKDNVLEKEIAAKDIVFVLDTSGSMADEGKMEKARAALLFGVRNLRATDRFNVINFAGEEHLMETGLISADAAGKKRGEDFVKNLKPVGGTNIHDALRAGLKQFDSSERPKLLVFMTDGLPTVGETNVEKIIQTAKEVKIENLRLFTFGVGYDVNTQLLDKIAAENSGTAEYVEPKEDLEVKVSNFFTKVNSPVLTGIDLNFGAAQIDLLYPRKTPDLFRGTQLTIFGRYKNAGDLKNVTVRLNGKNGRETRTFDYSNLAFPLRAEDNNFLPRLWATRRVGWIMEQIRANGEQKELRDEIVDLGTRYGIVTPYTSYLATDGSEQMTVTTRRLESLSPRARNAAPRAAANSIDDRSSADGIGLTSGEFAVKSSKDAKAKIEADKFEKQTSSAVQNVAAKTFYQDENGVWVDSEFKAESKLPETILSFASKEFFEVIEREKELAQFFALGEKVLVVWKGKIYRITK